MISAILNCYLDEMLILNKKTDAILWPITLDGLSGSKLGMMISNMHPEANYIMKKNIMAEKFKSGSVLLYEKSDPKILIVPVANDYLEKVNSEFVFNFVKKINSIKDKKNINEISIEKWKFSDEDLKIIKENKKFKVKIFDKKELIEEI